MFFYNIFVSTFKHRKDDNNMTKRISELREFLGLTKEVFSEKIGVATDSLENGDNITDEKIVTSICKEFLVSKEWLMHGTGPMFTPETLEDEFAMVMGEIIKSDNSNFKAAIVNAWKHGSTNSINIPV